MNTSQAIFSVSLHASQVTHRAGALVRFLSHEAIDFLSWSISTLGGLLISPLQGDPNQPAPIYALGWTEAQ